MGNHVTEFHLVSGTGSLCDVCGTGIGELMYNE